jgi:hypothetical protein
MTMTTTMTQALDHSRKLGIAEAALTMIAILAERDTDNPCEMLREIRDTARKALTKTSPPSRGQAPA